MGTWYTKFQYLHIYVEFRVSTFSVLPTLANAHRGRLSLHMMELMANWQPLRQRVWPFFDTRMAHAHQERRSRRLTDLYSHASTCEVRDLQN